MKKVKISITAFVLAITIAGTATANANRSEVEPCWSSDPLGIRCLNENNTPCCEDDGGNIIFEKNIIIEPTY